jgi:hypothetical protein
MRPYEVMRLFLRGIFRYIRRKPIGVRNGTKKLEKNRMKYGMMKEMIMNLTDKYLYESPL